MSLRVISWIKKMAQITVENVSKRFRGRGNAVTALEHINLEVRDGEFLALIGPSGCGKSTLLNIHCGDWTRQTRGAF